LRRRIPAARRSCASTTSARRWTSQVLSAPGAAMNVSTALSLSFTWRDAVDIVIVAFIIY
jgi:hypothetical protein